MARIRTIKPEFWQSDDIARLSLPARLLYIALWSYADDSGRFRDARVLIQQAAFPLDEDLPKEDVEGWFDELVTAGLVVRYEVDGRKLAHIPTFTTHQRPKYPTPSKLPAPPDPAPVLPQSFPNAGESRSASGRDISEAASLLDVVVVEVVDGEVVREQQPPPAAPRGAPGLVSGSRKRPAPQFPTFDQAHCDRLWQRWRQIMGPIDFGKFRKLFGAVFENAARLSADGVATVTSEQLDDAFEALLTVAPRGPSTRHLTAPACAELLTKLAARRADIADADRRLEVTFELVHGRPIPLKRVS
jgi:hypothetical protein